MEISYSSKITFMDSLIPFSINYSIKNKKILSGIRTQNFLKISKTPNFVQLTACLTKVARIEAIRSSTRPPLIFMPQQTHWSTGTFWHIYLSITYNSCFMDRYLRASSRNVTKELQLQLEHELANCSLSFQVKMSP